MTDALDTLLLEKSDLTADDLQQARDFAVQTGIGLDRALLKRKAAEEQERQHVPHALQLLGSLSEQSGPLIVA